MYEFVCICFRFSGAKVRIFPKTAKPRAFFFCKKINSRTKSRETLHLASAIFRFQGTSRPSATDPAPLFNYALSRHALRFSVSHCALRFSAGNKFPRLPVASHSPATVRVCQNRHILFFIAKPRLSQARALLCPRLFVPLDQVS